MYASGIGSQVPSTRLEVQNARSTVNVQWLIKPFFFFFSLYWWVPVFERVHARSIGPAKWTLLILYIDSEFHDPRNCGASGVERPCGHSIITLLLNRSSHGPFIHTLHTQNTGSVNLSRDCFNTYPFKFPAKCVLSCPCVCFYVHCTDIMCASKSVSRLAHIIIINKKIHVANPNFWGLHALLGLVCRRAWLLRQWWSPLGLFKDGTPERHKKRKGNGSHLLNIIIWLSFPSQEGNDDEFTTRISTSWC